MRMWIAAATAALALAACGKADPGPASVVEPLYAPYLAGAGGAPPPDLGAQPVLTPELKSVLDRASTYSNLLNEPVIDYDPLTGAQDWDIKSVVVTPKGAVKGDMALVTAAFDNLGAARRITFHMRRDPEGWRIDDIGDGQDSLRTIIETALQPAGDPAAMEAPVRAIYAQYALAGKRSPPLARWAGLSDALKRRMDAGADKLDFDPVVDGAAFDLGNVAYETVSSGVIARFDAGGSPKIVVYDMAAANGAWKIADIRSPGHWDLDVALREAGVE